MATGMNPPPNMAQPPGMTTTHMMPMKGGNNNMKMYGGNNNMKMYGGGKTKKGKKGLRVFGYRVPFTGGGKTPAVGSKASVFHGKAKHTSGGLTRKDLMKTKNGRIVSRKKHALGKKALKNLVKAGYKAKKGTFKLFRK